MYVFTKQQRIAELAKRSPQMGFTSLAYLMDIEWLIAAFHRTRKDGAPGVDGQTWFDYERNLEENLQSLLDRAKSGTYRAPPVRRVYIPKAGSATRLVPSESRRCSHNALLTMSVGIVGCDSSGFAWISSPAAAIGVPFPDRG